MADPTNRTVADIEASLDVSDAQLAAGETIPIEPVLKRVRQSIDRLVSKQRSEQRRKVIPHR
jgi:C4-type Zn-finger protein